MLWLCTTLKSRVKLTGQSLDCIVISWQLSLLQLIIWQCPTVPRGTWTSNISLSAMSQVSSELTNSWPCIKGMFSWMLWTVVYLTRLLTSRRSLVPTSFLAIFLWLRNCLSWECELLKALHCLAGHYPMAGPMLGLIGLVSVSFQVGFQQYLFPRPNLIELLPSSVGPALVDEAVSLAKSICSASADALFLCMLPVVHGSTNHHVVIKHRRHMEDLLLATLCSVRQCCKLQSIYNQQKL